MIEIFYTDWGDLMRKVFFTTLCLSFILITSLIVIDELTSKSELTNQSLDIKNNPPKEQLDYVDYPNVFIASISQNDIGICFKCSDPEVECACVDIYVDDDTKVEGLKNKFSELVEDDDVHVWVKDIQADKKIAEKIEVVR
jgi:hypothetical protein